MAKSLRRWKIASSYRPPHIVIILVFLPLLFLSSSETEARSLAVAAGFDPPLKGQDGVSYGPRVTINNHGRIVENTHYGVKNPDLILPSKCFWRDASELYHAGEDWYRQDGQGTAGATVTAIADGIVFDFDPANHHPGESVILQHGSPGQHYYSVYMHIKDVPFRKPDGSPLKISNLKSETSPTPPTFVLAVELLEQDT
jgi:hypothetical protein